MSGVWTGLALGLVLTLLCFRGLTRKSAALFIVLAAGVVFLDETALSITRLAPQLPKLPGQYNWMGKIAEASLGVLVMALALRFKLFDRVQAGLATGFHPNSGRAMAWLAPLLILETGVLWLLVPKGVPTIEDHVFQLFVPGVTEELIYRGVLLALLNRAFTARVVILGASMGWASVATGLLFGLMHGLRIHSDFSVSFDALPMAIPLVGGFVLAWCRERTGNLLAPILLHGGMNEVANLVGWVKAVI